MAAAPAVTPAFWAMKPPVAVNAMAPPLLETGALSVMLVAASRVTGAPWVVMAR